MGNEKDSNFDLDFKKGNSAENLVTHLMKPFSIYRTYYETY